LALKTMGLKNRFGDLKNAVLKKWWIILNEKVLPFKKYILANLYF
jgi:hypothetical protein